MDLRTSIRERFAAGENMPVVSARPVRDQGLPQRTSTRCFPRGDRQGRGRGRPGRMVVLGRHPRRGRRHRRVRRIRTRHRDPEPAEDHSPERRRRGSPVEGRRLPVSSSHQPQPRARGLRRTTAQQAIALFSRRWQLCRRCRNRPPGRGATPRRSRIQHGHTTARPRQFVAPETGIHDRRTHRALPPPPGAS